jgi:FkbM family methyltransferase
MNLLSLRDSLFRSFSNASFTFHRVLGPPVPTRRHLGGQRLWPHVSSAILRTIRCSDVLLRKKRTLLASRDTASEDELRDALRRLLGTTSEPFVIDVGANDGAFILGLDEVVPVRGLCIEPGPDAFARLLERLKTKPKLRALQAAIAEHEGQAVLNISKSDVGSSLLRPVPDQSSQWAQTVSQITVPTVRVESLLSSEGQFVDLLKIDTQGTDLSVLLSAGPLLNSGHVGAILVESNFHRIYEGQDSFADVYRVLTGCGYFLAELFRYYNRKGWLWYADALFLPTSERYVT